MALKNITARNYEEYVILSPIPVVINLTAKFCQAMSSLLNKKLDAISDQYGDYVRIVTLDMDVQPELREMLEIDTLPMIIMMTGGVVCKKIPGNPELEELIEVLELETIKDFKDRGITYHPKRNYIPGYIRDERW